MTMQMIASCTNIMLYKWQRIKVMCNEKDLPDVWRQCCGMSRRCQELASQRAEAIQKNSGASFEIFPRTDYAAT